MAAISGLSSISSVNFALSSPENSPRWGPRSLCFRAPRLSSAASRGRMSFVVRAAPPDKLSEKVAESIKEAEQACAGDPASGECVAAWDEVEELSAAASHARDKKKDVDVLEEYCKDNPETDECRTYDN